MTSEYTKATPVGPEFLDPDKVNTGSYALGDTPADDVREAVRRGYNASPGLAVDLVVESIVKHLAEVRPRGTVTDAEVEAGAVAIEAYDNAQPSGPFNVHEDNRGKARAVLEAVQEVRRGV